MSKMQVCFDVKTKETIPIDLDEIIKSRALFQANSGGGKSYLLRKFLEESHGKVQQLIIDPEGEFKTLKEKYDYLLVSKEDNADIKLETRHAGLLARRLMETGASAILDLYELNPFERIKFVRAFVEALVNLPKNLWHPCIIVIDEIHTFAPENAKGTSESLQAVADLASRGRKRGYALVGATQKLSKFHKDVASELNTKFTGRCVLDIDQKRAAAELGMKDYTELRNLTNEFYAFGPAVSGTPILVKAYPVKTRHEDIGSSKPIQAASQDKINKLKESFKDLPVEAEQELKTINDYQKKIQEQNIEIRNLKQSAATSSSPKIDPQALQKAEQIGIQKGFKDAEKQFIQIKIDAERYIKKLETMINAIVSDVGQLNTNAFSRLNDTLQTPVPEFNLKLPTAGPQPGTFTATALKPITVGQAITVNDIVTGHLSEIERKILIAIAQRNPKQASKQQISLITEYSIKSSGFDKALGKLKRLGLIEGTSKLFTITAAGLEDLGSYEPLANNPEQLREIWIAKVGQGCGKMLRTICEVHPNTISKQEIADKSGFSVKSSGFDKNLARLSSTGLIDRVGAGQYKASKELFPE